MKIISVVGKRGSGKTTTAIQAANDLAAMGHRVGVVFEGPRHSARLNERYLIRPARAVFEDDKGFRHYHYDYIIYDGYFHPESSARYNCSP